jgi:WD40 repeat protein
VRRLRAGTTVAVLAACSVASVLPAAGAPTGLGALALESIGTIDLGGSVTDIRMDTGGTRLLVSTVSYPGNGSRRDEAHLYELSGRDSKGDTQPVHMVTWEIDDAVSVALSPDGERVAVSCEGGVCIRRWAVGVIDTRLAAPGRRRETGALALRPERGLLVASQRQRMEILVWDLSSGTDRRWAVASPGERLREGVTPRLHGRPPWIPRWVGVAPEGERVASNRDDGTVSLWTRTGQAVKSLRLPPHADLDPAFTPDGRLVAVRVDNGRLAVVDVESERVLLEVEDRPSRSPRGTALLPGAGAAYLATSGPGGVRLHSMSSGELAVSAPVPDAVWRLGMSGDGRVLAVAFQHRVVLWRVAPGP